MLNAPPKRRSHYTPAPLPGVTYRMTPRATLVLSLLESYRLLRTTHIVELLRYYNNIDRLITKKEDIALSPQKTIRWLRCLMDDRHILRIRHDPDSKTVAQGSLPKIHGLNIPANEALNERRERANRIVPHTLAIADTIVFGVVKPCRESGGQIRFIDAPEIIRTMARPEIKTSAKPYTWPVPVMFNDQALRLSITPDWLFGTRFTYRDTGNVYFFALEEDLSSEPVERRDDRGTSLRTGTSLFRKLLTYAFAYHHQVQYVRYGIPGFRVLFVTGSPKRVAHMVELWDLANSALKAFQKAGGLEPKGCPKNVFLFIDRPTLRQHTLFTAPWVNARGESVTIAPPQP
jgi:hypothetical protein